MSNKKMYLPCVIISIIMVFTIISLQILSIFKCEVLSGDAFTKAIQTKSVSSMVYNSLNDYFSEQYNSTGIPPEVYMQSLTQDDVSNIIQNSANNSLAYIRGTNSSLNIDYDFSKLETSITEFFTDYANSIDYPKNETFYSKVYQTVNNTITLVEDNCDVFKFTTMNDVGLLNKIKSYYKYIDYALYTLIGLFVVLLVVLIIINKKNLIDCFYWLGNSLSISSLLILIPCIYVKATDYFASFSIKATGTYEAITGLLNVITDSYITMLSISLFLGIICLIISLLVLKKST